jgi:hypothetical protein
LKDYHSFTKVGDTIYVDFNLQVVGDFQVWGFFKTFEISD